MDNIAITTGELPFDNLVWVGGAGGNAWDVNTTANWTNITDATGPVVFTNTDAVTFDDSSANTTVNISGTVEPTSITVTNDVNNYTFSGGTLAGAGGLTKLGTGSLDLLGGIGLAYTGATEISGGTLSIDIAANNTLSGGISGGGALAKWGVGTLTLGGANSFSGTATVNAGTLEVLTTASGSASYQVGTATTLSVSDASGASTLAASSLSFSSGSTSLTINDGGLRTSAAVISTANLTNAGTVTVTYSASSYAPGSIALIDYEAASSTLGNYTLTPIGGGVIASLATNVANSSIDLVITSVPVKTWAGTDATFPDLWDILTTPNWTGAATIYTDGDAVRFDDTGATTAVNVNNYSPVAPSLVWLTNSTAYSFANGTISAPLLIKEGIGTASLLAAGNSFTSIDLREGTLSYQAGTPTTETAAITGAGTLAVDVDPFTSPTTLTLSGNMSGFDGPITVANANTLTLGANNVLGTTNSTTTIASGATLEINGRNVRGEQVIVSGNGTDSFSGAIVNSGGQVTTAFDHVSLAGATSFGGTGRWDIRAVDTSGANNAKLDTTAGTHALTKRGANEIRLNNTDISSGIGSITVEAGNFYVEQYSSFANPATPVTVWSGALFGMGGNNMTTPPSFSAALTLEGGSTLNKSGNEDVTFAGTINLTGDATFAGGNLHVTGAVTGGGGITKTGPGTHTLSAANTYFGATTVSAGTLTLSTASSGTSGYTAEAGTTLGALRTSAGGTLTMTSLTLGDTGSGTVTLLFDLGTFDGSPTAALMDISGGTLTTNAATYNVEVAADLNVLTTGTVSLLKYAPGTFTNDVVYTPTTGIDGYATNNTSANQVELVVTSVSRALTWRGDVNTDWNINTTANWLDATNSTVYKEIGAVGDIVTFGDGASNYTVNLATTVSPGGQYVQVTSSNVYTFSGTGGIAGPVGVRVTDTGAGLVLGGNNTYSGGTFFDNGTITVSSESNLGDSSSELRWAGGTMQANGSLTNTRPLAFQSTGSDSRISVATNQTVQLGGTINNASVNTPFWKSGPGTLVLTNQGSLRLFVNEGTTVLAGNAALTNLTSAQNFGSGDNDDGTLIVKDNALMFSEADFNIGDGLNATNTVGELYIQNDATLVLESLYVGKFSDAIGRVYQTGGTVTNNAAGNWYLGGNSSNASGAYYLSGGSLDIPDRDLQVGRAGSGEFVVSGTGSVQARAINVGTQTTGTGNMVVDGAPVTLSLNLNVPLNGLSATVAISNNAVVTANALVFGTASAVDGSVTVSSGGTLTVGKVSGLATGTRAITFDDGTLKASGDSATFMEGLTSATIGAGGLTVDTDTNTITIGQNLTGTGGLTKEGDGTLVLKSQSYTGDTVVNAGTLNSEELVTTTLAGALTVNAGGTVAPGESIAKLLATGSVTLGGSANLEVARESLFVSDNDAVQAGGSITLGGTLNVTFDDSHAEAVVVGTSFTLFQAVGGLSGSFATVNLPTTDPVTGDSITWTDTTDTDGKITVASVASPVTPGNPQNVHLDGSGNLVFSITNASGIYRVQGATNMASPVWIDVATNTAPFNFTNNATLPEEFFRTVTP